MKKNTANGFLPLLISLLTIGSPIAFVSVWLYSNSVQNGVLAIIAYLIILMVSGIANQVWSNLETSWSKKISDSIERSVQNLLSRFQYRYHIALAQKNRFLDIRGLGRNELSYDLFLDQVYVDLDYAYYYEADRQQGKIDLWGSLKEKRRDTAQKYVIIGSPGSGKTTLLRYISLVISNNNSIVVF
jgi:hypothetical protein